ncbi:MAG TPA: SLC13 family permease [Candidatus Polarisedimenticolia bacterium]|jgi:sodium-dependent dicarboxylate transporter 2/3/5|nr:SLC13 family permease [Candidatus Polarisedimenticolia bacterium]
MSAGGPDGDDRFERRMKTTGLVAGPLVALAVFAANPGGHPPEGRRLLAVLTLTIAFWVTEAIPLPATALLASALCIVLGVAPVRAVLAPYSDPVIFVFVGSFLLAEAFTRYGLDVRVAARFLGRGPLARRPLGRMLGVGGASALVSTCLSNTATAALMTPIAIGAVRGPATAHGRRVPEWVSGVLLMVAYGASVGGMATLIGTPPNLLVAGFIERLAGVHVGFVGWLLFGVPISVVLLAASVLFTHLVLGRGAGSPAEAAAIGIGAPAEPASAAPAAGAPDGARRAGARWTILAFLLAASLWTLPSLASMLLGPASQVAAALAAHLPEAGVAILCATLLFVAPVEWRARRFTLTWEDGRRVNWGIILLFGGGLSLGTLADSTGVAAWVGAGLQEVGLARTPAGLLFCAVALTIVVSEFASNTAAAALLVPMVIAAAAAAGFDPVRPALGVGLAATCGFIFPVSTPPNAIVFGTGLVPLRRMIRTGILLDLTALVVIWAGLLLLTPILPR